MDRDERSARERRAEAHIVEVLAARLGVGCALEKPDGLSPHIVIRRRSGLRLGISGSHATGKSTLAAELRSALPQWIFVEEAYTHLLEEGEEFGAKPTIDDIEAQLLRSIDLIGSISGPDVVFERCPVDYIAYLTALRADTETVGYWLQESRDALASLNALIFVPVEQPDRIFVGSDDLPKLRSAVDRHLRQALIEDSWGLRLTVHECHGSPADRAGQVLSWIHAQGDAT